MKKLLKQTVAVSGFGVLVAAIVVFVLTLICAVEQSQNETTPSENGQVVSNMRPSETSLVSIEDEQEMLVEWRRRRERQQYDPADFGFDEDVEEQQPRRRRRRGGLLPRFDGSRLQGMGKGLLWLAVGIVAVPVACLLSFAMCKKILGIQ